VTLPSSVTPSLRDVIDVPGPWTHAQVAANGAQFHVAEMGSGPLVLLLHGFPEFWWTWRHQLPALAGAGFRVAAMDLRGYGGSDKTPRGYDPYTVSADITGVVRALGRRSAVIVGHGWGGFFAWTAAVLRPGHVDSIAVLSMAHPLQMRRAMRSKQQRVAARHALRLQLPWRPERALVADDGAEVERILRAWSAPGSGFPDEAARRYRDALSVWPAPHCSLEYHRWAFRSLLRPDGARFAAKMAPPVQVPVLQIHGSLDPAVLPATARASSEHVAGPYEYTELSGVGHFPQEEAPDVVTERLTRWLLRHTLRSQQG
jgi:pimeloyl-ACP methyl ester carboxylesterase